MLLLLCACLINTELYLERMAAVTDDDGDGYNDDEGDCADADPDRHPGAAEACDDEDNDCDGYIDEDITDAEACDGLDNDCDGHVDEDITDAEVCDGLDNDCDGATDEDLDQTWYLDGDGDGFGNAERTSVACAQPHGHVATGDDCDDGNDATFPGATESCNGADDDCDGATDEDLASHAGYVDADGDGYGAGDYDEGCDVSSSVVATGDDCDDNDATVSPGEGESIDGRDEDCSGAADDLDAEDDAIAFVAAEPYGWAGSALLWADLDADGDDDLVIGAPGRESGGDDCGVYAIDAGDLASGDMGRASTVLAGTSTRCGAAVAWDGSRLLVGAPEDDGGRVSVFSGSSLATAATWSHATAGDAGSALATGGDVDGDGLDDVAVGAPAISNEDPRDGTVVLLPASSASGELLDLATATIIGTAARQQFGDRLALGDLDGDGYADLAVGAPEAEGGGLAWLFLGGTALPATAADADASYAGSEYATAGSAVAVATDWDGDGEREWWVGASGESDALAFPDNARGVLDSADAVASVLGETGILAADALAGAHTGLLIGAPAAMGRDGVIAWFSAPALGTDFDEADATLAGGPGAEAGAAVAAGGSWWAAGAPEAGTSDEGAVYLVAAP
ncbi:MAG: FG-GAP repeat protein [Deltaproteobacteria bacterium]|nr:FG-GAP repeat protein [Deltaproteobacteria bacterium]